MFPLKVDYRGKAFLSSVPSPQKSSLLLYFFQNDWEITGKFSLKGSSFYISKDSATANRFLDVSETIAAATGMADANSSQIIEKLVKICCLFDIFYSWLQLHSRAKNLFEVLRRPFLSSYNPWFDVWYAQSIQSAWRHRWIGYVCNKDSCFFFKGESTFCELETSRLNSLLIDAFRWQNNKRAWYWSWCASSSFSGCESFGGGGCGRCGYENYSKYCGDTQDLKIIMLEVSNGFSWCEIGN